MITEKQHQEWKRDLIELHKLQADNERLKTVVEAEKRKNIIAKEFHGEAEVMIKKLQETTIALDDENKRLAEQVDLLTLGLLQGKKDITCPFCGKEDYDLIGLKHHLMTSCKVYSKTSCNVYPKTKQ